MVVFTQVERRQQSAVMNQTIPIHQVSAFAEAPFEGNPAAICTLDAWLPEVLMQRSQQKTTSQRQPL